MKETGSRHTLLLFKTKVISTECLRLFFCTDVVIFSIAQ